jgi:WD40 repeat protein
MKLRILLAGLICSIALVAADSGAELFQKAVTQEQAAGNLPEAIKLYQQVAKDYASNRPLAAKALVQAARCYEKLGEGQAQKLYEQVTRDFSDQVELANTARSRLAALREAAPATMTARRVDSVDSPIMIGYGQRTFLIEGKTLFSADGHGNNKHSIHTFPPAVASWGRADFSRDLSLVLIGEGPTEGPFSITLMKSDGTVQRNLGEVNRTGPVLFSWDNRYAVLAEPQKDGSSHIIRLTLADGHRQEILRRENAVIDVVQFSPDGRFIAFTESSAGSNKVLVVPSAGGEPVVLAEDSGLVDWTRDGHYLAVNSGRPTARALYLLPMKDGRAAGAPVFIRNGAIEQGWTLPSGALMYRTVSNPGDVIFIGTLAADGHVEGWKPLYLETGISGNPRPDWSPDGRQIVYIAGSLDSNRGVSTVRVHDLATGADRELYRDARPFQTCHFATLRPKIYCAFSNSVTTDFMEIAPDTLVAENLASVDGMWVMHEVSPDDSEFYGYNFGKGLERWNRETHQATPMGEGIYPSPDGRWVWTGGAPTKPQSDPSLQLTLEIRRTSEAAWRHIGYFRMRPWRSPGPIHATFTPDGEWFYFHARDAADKDALFRVSTAGGEPTRLGDIPSHAIEGSMRVTRDGRQILLVAPDAASPRIETWLLENFEPKQTAAK